MAVSDRTHVHLCFTDHRDQTYALHTVDVAPLFHSAPDPDPESMDVAALQLPPPTARFQPPPDPMRTVMNFHLLGGNRVVSIDELRRTLIYDAGTGAIRAGPMLRAPKWHTLSASIGDDSLYLLDHIIRREHRHCFEALLYVPSRDDWYWRDLPQPPYVHAPGYTPSEILSRAVAGAAIWTYTRGVGTYSFDTARRAWRKEGDWALPFRGKAEYVPGCGLWFGISSADHRRLCAVDLAASTASLPPKVCGVWEDFRPHREWFWRNSAVVHLGSGKLCTVRFFATDRTDRWQHRGTVLVLTAVEIETHDGGGNEIRMVRHRSTVSKSPTIIHS